MLNSNSKTPNVPNSTPAPIANGEVRKRSSRARDLALKKKALEESAEMNGEDSGTEDCGSVSGRSTRSSRRVAKSQALHRPNLKNKIVKEANDALKLGEEAKTSEKPTNTKIENKPLNKTNE